MGLVAVALAMLCLEAVCPGDDTYDLSVVRKDKFQRLSAEIKEEYFRISTTETSPLSFTQTVNGTLVGKGVAFEFINILRDKYQFKYDVIKPQQSSLEKDGGGIFSQLYREEAEIAAAFVPVMPSFRQFIDYSRALDEGEWVVLMKRPPASATGSGLWAPFTFQVWILILVSLVIVGPIIYGLIVLEARLRKQDDCPIFPLPSCVWFVYGALLKQGSTLSPITDSSRLLFATWWIFITILTAFYTANLTAFLTLSKFTLPVSKIEDIGQKKYNWITHKGSAIEENYKQMNDFKQKFYGSKYEFVDNDSDDILNEWVLNRNYLFIEEKPIVDHLMYKDYIKRADPAIKEADRCTYVITKWIVLTTARAFAFKKGFKYYELFNEIIQHLVESGIIRYKMRDSLPNTEICPLDLGNKERQLYNSDLIMTYVIVGAGFAVSGLVFIIELLLHRYNIREIKSKPPRMQNLFEEDNNNDVRRRKNGEFKFATFKDNDHVNGKLWHEMAGNVFPPPPPYHALYHPPFANSPNGVRKTINGRDYWVVKSVFGDTKLIPVRTPSALLFQYTK